MSEALSVHHCFCDTDYPEVNVGVCQQPSISAHMYFSHAHAWVFTTLAIVHICALMFVISLT